MKSDLKEIDGYFWLKWILASLLGGIVGHGIGLFSFWFAMLLHEGQFYSLRVEMVVFAAIFGAGMGLGVGSCQWLVLRNHVSWAKLWPITSIFACTVYYVILHVTEPGKYLRSLGVPGSDIIWVEEAIWTLGSAIVGAVLVIWKHPGGNRMLGEEPGDTAQVSGESSERWYKIWLQAFFRPTQDTIAELVLGHDHDRLAPYRWLFFSTVIGYALWVIPYSIYETHLGALLLSIGLLLMGVLWVIAVRIQAAITQFIAKKLLGGEGTSSELFYITAAMASPAILIWGLVNLGSLLIPWIANLWWVVWLYEFVLLAIAVKTTNRFSWSRAVIAVLPFFALAILDLLW